MSYIIQCRCGKELIFDEKPDHKPFCKECTQRINEFSRLRKIVENKLKKEKQDESI